jgi:uncharacterized protein YlxW (UPF0749 family)
MRKAGPPGPAAPTGALRALRWQAVIAAMLAFIGFLGVAQIRTEVQIKRTLRIPSTQLAEFGFMLREQERSRAALESQVAELRARLADYERAAAEGRSATARLSRQLQEVRTLVGLGALEGPGVVITMNDSTRAPRAGEDPNKTILHYSDINGVVAELWAAGAEAVALNGERIVGSTGINCVGTTVLCNTKRMAPPYHITAIGDPRRMTAYVKRPGSSIEMLTAFDFPVRIAPAERVTVPAYRGTFRFDHATVAAPARE